MSVVWQKRIVLLYTYITWCVIFVVYRTFPLNDPRLGSKKLHHLPIPHPSSSEAVGSSRPRNSDTDIALQNLAKLDVSNKGIYAYVYIIIEMLLL